MPRGPSNKQAWEWIGISKDSLKGATRLSQALKRLGEKEEILNLLRRSDAPEAKKVLSLVDSSPSKKFVDVLPLEAFCHAAGVSTKKFFSVVAEVVFEESQNEAAILAALGVPEVVSATVTAALAPGGTREREMILKHARIVPVPKTSITTFIGNPQIDASQKVAMVMPVAEEGVKKMSEKFNRDITGGGAPEPKGLPMPEGTYEAEWTDED